MDTFNIILNDKNNKKIEINRETTFKEIVDKYYKDEDIMLCNFNNVNYELSYKIPGEGNIEGVKADTDIGWRVYTRTLQFIFLKAVSEVFPNTKVTMQHSISKGIFGEIHSGRKLTQNDIDNIKEKMNDLIKRDVPIKSISVKREFAENYLTDEQMQDKRLLLEHSDLKNVTAYELEGTYDYFFGQMAYSTGVIKAFDVIIYEHGFVLRQPSEDSIDILPKFVEQKKLAKIFYETKQWLRIIGIGEVGSLNEHIADDDLKNVILVAEALHEKKIAYIADTIADRKDVKIVLIAGPSSSGKTTFANRLGIQLRVNGLTPIPISLDDYFVSREFTPKDENGDYDFESIDAIDLKLFNENLQDLLDCKEVEIPSYNFKTGQREWIGNKMKLPSNGVIVVEGIHGLNPNLTNKIEKKNKFEIYISALTQLNLDDHNRIATTDVRKIRRITRDFLSRGYSAEDTLKMWPSIKRGEKKNIFVFQEEADVMFNSMLVYELCVLKPFAIQQLKEIKEDSPVYYEAQRLLGLLDMFKKIDVKDVPENSILREFIGGSCFYKY